MKRGWKVFEILFGLFFILSILFFMFSSEKFYGKITGNVVSSSECSDGTPIGQIQTGTGSARWMCTDYTGNRENLDCYGGDDNLYLNVETNGWKCGRWGWECGGNAYNSGYCCGGVNQQQSCPINGECVSYAEQTLNIQPTNLCLQGTASSVTTETNTYSWTCQGNNGGSSASCSATKQNIPSINENEIPDAISNDLQLLKEGVEERDVNKCYDIKDENSNLKTSCFDIFSSTYEEDYCDKMSRTLDPKYDKFYEIRKLCKSKVSLFKAGEFPAFCGDNKINQEIEQCDGDDSPCVSNEYCNKCYCYKDVVDKAYIVKQIRPTPKYTTTELTQAEYNKIKEQDNNFLVTADSSVHIEFDIKDSNIKNVNVNILMSSFSGVTVSDRNRKNPTALNDYSKNGFFGIGGYYGISETNLNVIGGKARMSIGIPWTVNIDMIKISKYNKEIPTKP